MDHESREQPAAPAEQAGTSTVAHTESDGLLDRLALIESQPLDRRAQGFEQLHDELLQELQRSDNESA